MSRATFTRWRQIARAFLDGFRPDFFFRAEFARTEAIQRAVLRRPHSHLQLLFADLEVDACPACRAGVRAERRYLAWVSSRRHRRMLAEPPVALRASHLNDLWLVAPRRAIEVLTVIAAATAADLQDGWRSFAGFPADGFGSVSRSARWRTERLISIFDGGNEQVCGSRQRRPSPEPISLHGLPAAAKHRGCMACAVRDNAEHWASHLLLSALDVQSVVLDYSHSHGLCARHVLQQPETLHHELLRDELRSRVELEVGLIRLAHHRASGVAGIAQVVLGKEERQVLLAGMALLDGHIFLGDPPPQGP